MRKFMIKILIKLSLIQGKRHKIRDEKIAQWCHDNGIGA